MKTDSDGTTLPGLSLLHKLASENSTFCLNIPKTFGISIILFLADMKVKPK